MHFHQKINVTVDIPERLFLRSAEFWRAKELAGRSV
jgi:hypothetical protein